MSNHTKNADRMNDEWYTSPEIIESARNVLGTIDVDVASCDFAQQTVKAEIYYTKENSSLDLDVEWNGNVWMNPPYSRIISAFCSKLVRERKFGRLKSAITLTNNGTDTAWFHELMRVASVVCFTKGRLAFYGDDGEYQDQNMKGQVMTYTGDNPDLFISEFSKYGVCMRVV